MTPRRAGFVFGLWFYKDFAPTVLRQTAADEVRAVLGDFDLRAHRFLLFHGSVFKPAKFLHRSMADWLMLLRPEMKKIVLTRLEPFGKRRKEFGKAESP
jgi:hypothetical protein